MLCTEKAGLHSSTHDNAHFKELTNRTRLHIQPLAFWSPHLITPVGSSSHARIFRWLVLMGISPVAQREGDRQGKFLRGVPRHAGAWRRRRRSCGF